MQPISELPLATPLKVDIPDHATVWRGRDRDGDGIGCDNATRSQQHVITRGPAKARMSRATRYDMIVNERVKQPASRARSL